MNTYIKSFKGILAVILLFTFATSCNEQEEQHLALPEEELLGMEKYVSQNSNQLANRLMMDICSGYPDTNVSLSPVTAFQDLSLIRKYGTGATRNEVLPLLGPLPVDPSLAEDVETWLFCRLEYYATNLNLSLKNSLWMNSNSTQIQMTDSKFNKKLANDGVHGAMLDFSKPSAAQMINQWASSLNESVQFVNRLPEDANIMIADFSRFYSGWTGDYFDSQKEHELLFHNADGSVDKVAALQTTEELGYYSTPEYVASSFRFGVGGNLRWIIVMPEQMSLSELSQKLGNSGGLVDVYAKTKTDYTYGSEVIIPRLDIQSELDLKPSFERLGVKSAFNPALSDFSPLIKGARLSIDQVLHKSVFRVSEKGVSSFWGDAMLEVWNSFFEQKPEVISRPALVYDKPFLFFVIEEKTQTILYLGKVEKI